MNLSPDPRSLARYFPGLRIAGGLQTRDVSTTRGLDTTVLFNDAGLKAVNVLRVASNVADAETVTIGKDVYEFDRAANGVTAGRIAVTGHADDTPAAATNALITAINTKGTEPVTAIDISDNEVLIAANAVGAVTTACAESLAGANNAWAATAMYGGRAAGKKKISVQSRVPLTQEVNLGNMHFLFDFAPTILEVYAYVTATPGLSKSWNGAATVIGNRLTLDNSGTTDWTTSDTVVVVVTD
jgi:hypothetical protein